MQQTNLNLPNPLAARDSLFLSTDGQPFTTSRAVAERFNKRHRDVLRTIHDLLKKTCDPDFNERNFALIEYLDPRGRTKPEYRLTHDGFAFLTMRFTGDEAIRWQIAFIQAFNALEAELRAKEARFASALDQIRPCLRPVVEGTELGESRAVIAKTLGRSAASVSYHRSRARHLGLLPPVHTNTSAA